MSYSTTPHYVTETTRSQASPDEIKLLGLESFIPLCFLSPQFSFSPENRAEKTVHLSLHQHYCALNYVVNMSF